MRPSDHPGLLDALQELTTIGLPEIIEPDVAEVDAEFSSLEQPFASESSPPAEATAGADRSDSRAGVFSTELSSALQELASTVPVNSASGLQHPQRTESSAAQRHSLIPMMLILPAFAVGLLLGTFWRSDGTAVTPQPERQSDQKQASIVIPPAAGQRQLNGVVLWKDDSGNTSPDAGALILLLTTENSTRLRLDGRPLRESADSTARKAIEAALQTLGSSVHQADATGAWSANVSAETELTMIVVSRHRSRTDSQRVPPKILDTLNQWFEAPLHVIGRLSVQQKVIPASANNTDPAATSLDIEFSSQK